MRFKSSLLYPILSILLLLAGSTLLIGYYLNLDTLRDALERREADKADAIYFCVNAEIQQRIKDLSTLSQILRGSPRLLDGLRYYQLHGAVEPLRQAMEHLYAVLAPADVDVFLVTDRQGNIVYPASPPGSAGKVYRVWGFEEALSGEDIRSAGYGPDGWAIRTLVPLSRGSELQWVLILGISLDDAFARKIAKATNTNVSLGTPYRILASSWLPAQRRIVNLSRISRSILEKRSFFQIDDQSNTSSIYIPIEMVDETLCLVINTDTTAIAELLRQKRRQLILTFFGVLVAILGIGSGLTYSIVRPLRKLQRRASDVVQEYFREDLPVPPVGNEIETLSQAMELMLAALQKHLAELHQAQATLREREQFLASVLDHIQDRLVVLDRDFTLLRVNSAAERRFAHGQSLVGQKCYAAFHGLTQPCADCPCRQTQETGEAAYQLKRLEGATGEAMEWVELFTFPLRDPATGQVTGVIEYGRDVTERKLAEDALRQREEQLRQAAKMEAVGRLAGGVAHDFNNILTAILGECELLLLHLAEPDPVRQEVMDIHQAALRAASLTRQLLAFSRRQVLLPQPLDLNAVVANLDKMLRRIIGEDIELVTILLPNLGTVKVDPGQMEQVLLNLAINARDAMPQGGKLTLETVNVDLDEDYAHRHPGTQPGSFVMLAVSDTGVGLDETARSHIFEPFYTTKDVGRGTGLGLSMVYGIVKQSGGEIWVYSESGQGTTFKIYLPCYGQPEELVEPGPAPVISPPGSETILVVEDEGAVLGVVSRLLEQQGYQVLAAAGGPEALSLSRQHQAPIHLLLTDVVMPGMSGRELADRLLAQRPHLKVLFMSGYAENAIVHHGVLEPGIAFIQKPFRLGTLAARLREVLAAPHYAPPDNPSAA